MRSLAVPFAFALVLGSAPEPQGLAGFGAVLRAADACAGETWWFSLVTIHVGSAGLLDPAGEAG